MEAEIPTIVIKQENDSQFYYEDGLTYTKHDEEEFISNNANYQGMMLNGMTRRRDLRELLIQLIREEPRLWDHRNKAYHNQDVKCQLWESIGKKLNLTDVEVKSKWQILRSNYMRERRKLKTIPPGAAEAHKAKINWTFFSMMSFLDDSLGMRRKSRIVKRDSEGLANSISCKLENSDEGMNSCVTEDTNSQSDTDPQERVTLQNLNERIIKQSSSDEESDSRYFKQLDNNDPDILFFKSLIPQIKQLDSSQNLSFKVEVAQLLLRKLQPAAQTSSVTSNVIES